MPKTVARSPEVNEFASQLRRRGIADVLDASDLTRALYSSDASLYRVVPQAVARPRTIDETAAVLDAARAVGIPVTTRGAGTSCAGNAVGSGLILDTSRHLNTILDIDPEARTARVEPGVVQSALQIAAAPHGLRFGPDPSTRNRCTIGGMIGNNACGPRALGYGKTSDNVIALEMITGSGEHVTLHGADHDHYASLAALRSVVQANLGIIRTEFGRFERQVSGYSLEHLLPENRFDVTRFLAGSEGTLAVIIGATVRLVAEAPSKIMIVLGYPTMADAADAAPLIVDHRPTACEGLDRRIVEVVRRTRGETAVPPLPRGNGWMFVELVGEDLAELRVRADALLAAAGASDGVVVTDPAQALALWKIREDGAGLAGISLARPAYPGWEDAALPAQHLGSYLRDFDRLLIDHGLGWAAVRSFRGRMRARPHRLPADRGGRSSELPILRRGGSAAGCRLWRLAVGRARRRPGAVGAAIGDVFARCPGGLRPGKGRLRPGEPVEPRRVGRSSPGGQRPPRSRSAGARRPLRRKPCTVAPAWANASPTPQPGWA